ncbi:MAG: CARDB domain-containing protein [Pseudomonadota bacterium]
MAVGDGQFDEVSGVAFAPNDRIVTVEAGNDRVQVFDLDGNFVLKFGNEGSNNGQFQNPSDVAVDNAGNIYVADLGNRRVQVFDSDGGFLRAFGSFCNLDTSAGCVDPDGGGPLELGDGQFIAPNGLAVDYAGNVYVADGSVNHRVQVFDPNGDFVAKFSLPEDAANLRDVAVDAMARLHVTTGNPGGTPSDVPFVVGVFVIDTDGDSLPDLWEQAGIDVNLDGDIDLDLTDLGDDYRGVPMVADPNRKDIFVEIDYFDCNVPGNDCDGGTHSHRPRDEALDLIVQAFNNAPVTQGNGINLWVQVNEGLPHQQFCDFEDGGCFDDIKATSFGTPAERGNPDTLAAKALVFRYNLWVHDQKEGSSVRGTAEGSAGEVGNDFIVSLGSFIGGGSTNDHAGVFMHELGHTLGLGHGGGDNRNCKPNYLSVMSYTFTDGLQPYGQFDYSRSVLPTSGALVEDDLDETIGIQDGAFLTFYGPPRDVDGIDQGDDGDFNDDWAVGLGAGAIDWDFDGSADDNPATPTDLNFLGIIGCGLDKSGAGAPDDDAADTLTGHNDWDNIQIGFRDSPFFEDGKHGDPVVEIDFATTQFIRDQVWRAQLEEIHEYSAKFICGIQDDPDEFRLTPGRYATIVNIRNPNREPVTFKKMLALAYPPEEQVSGEMYEISLDTLRYGEALKVDCEDVRKNLFDGKFPEPYIEGFLVVHSPESLDVASVYTTATVGGDDDPPRHSDIEIVSVAERIIELEGEKRPDLVIDERLDFQIDCLGSDATQKCKVKIAFSVRNIGDAAAGPFNVRIVLEHNDTLLEDMPINEQLAPGEVANRTLNAEFAIFGQDPDGKTICLKADAPTNQVEEKSENNNERCLDF